MSEGFPRRPPIPARPPQHRVRRRRLTDWLTRVGVSAGGLLVILLVALIFAYLLWVVMPLFSTAEVTADRDQQSYLSPADPGVAEPTRPAGVWLSIEESDQALMHLTADGQATFLQLADGQVLSQETLALPAGTHIAATASAGSWGHRLLALSDGSVLPVQLRFVAQFDQGVRRLVPHFEFPFGREPLAGGLVPDSLLSYQIDPARKQAVVAGSDGRGHIRVWHLRARQNLLTGSTTVDRDLSQFIPDSPLRHLQLSGDLRWMFGVDASQALALYEIRGSGTPTAARSCIFAHRR